METYPPTPSGLDFFSGINVDTQKIEIAVLGQFSPQNSQLPLLKPAM